MVTSITKVVEWTNVVLKVKGLISTILTNPEFSQQIFVKETKYETSRKSAQRERSCPKWVDGRTDGQDGQSLFATLRMRLIILHFVHGLHYVFCSTLTIHSHRFRRHIFLIQICCVLWEVKTEPSCIRQINISLQSTTLRIITQRHLTSTAVTML